MGFGHGDTACISGSLWPRPTVAPVGHFLTGQQVSDWVSKWELAENERAMTRCRQIAFGEWCNGSTADSGSACLGSNPSSPASQGPPPGGPSSFPFPLKIPTNPAET